MSSPWKHLQTGNPERQFEAGEIAGQGEEAIWVVPGTREEPWGGRKRSAELVSDDYTLQYDGN